jgi:hypothetical protein
LRWQEGRTVLSLARSTVSVKPILTTLPVEVPSATFSPLFILFPACRNSPDTSCEAKSFEANVKASVPSPPKVTAPLKASPSSTDTQSEISRAMKATHTTLTALSTRSTVAALDVRAIAPPPPPRGANRFVRKDRL